MDAKGVTITETKYDKAGNPVEVMDALGNRSAFSYDSRGRLTGTTRNLNTAAEAKSGYGYDKTGRLLTVTDAEGGTGSYEYDDAGNIIVQTDPNGGITAREYDSMGRLLYETDAIGSRSINFHNQRIK